MANDDDNQNIDQYGADSIWAADPFKSPYILARYVLDNADYAKHTCRVIQNSDALKLKLMEKLESVVNDPDTNDYSVLTMLAADYILKGENLPPWLRKFAAEAITGKIKPRAKKGRKKKITKRDFALWAAVELVSDIFGIPKYAKGNETRQTAAHIVSVVAGTSYNVVEHAFRNYAHFAPPILNARNTP